METIYRITQLRARYQIKNISKQKMILKVTQEIHSIMFDAGLTKHEAQMIAAALKKSIYNDDWK